MTPEIHLAQARSGRTALYWFLGSECVVVVVGNYKGCSWINEVYCSSACTFGFANRVEAKSPPEGCSYCRPEAAGGVPRPGPPPRGARGGAERYNAPVMSLPRMPQGMQENAGSRGRAAQGRRPIGQTVPLGRSTGPRR